MYVTAHYSKRWEIHLKDSGNENNENKRREQDTLSYDTILENMIVRDGIEQHRIETIVAEQFSTP